MKRARIWRMPTACRPWLVRVWDPTARTSHPTYAWDAPRSYYTHGEALKHALAELGLTVPAEHREVP